MRDRSRWMYALLIPAVFGLLLGGCRRNLMRVSTTPPGAQVFIQGKLVTLEDSDRRLAAKIDSKKERGRDLSEEEAEFDANRKRAQATEIQYEFESIAAGYSIYCMKPGYEPLYQVEFIKPRWYEYPPIDFFVDLLPVTITDERAFSYQLQPTGPGPRVSDAR